MPAIYHQIEENLQQTFVMSEQEKTDLADYSTALSVKLEQLKGFNEIMAFEDALTDVDMIQTGINELYENMKSQRKAMLQSIKKANGQINATKIYESNLQIVNEAFLTYLISETNTLSESYIGSLEYIANQCPLTGGTAVFKARSLLSMVGSYDFDDAFACGETTEKRPIITETDDFQPDYRFYPNPAKIELTVAWRAALVNAAISITDLSGKQVLYRTVLDNSRRIDLSVNTLNTGIYLINIMEDDSTIFSDKVVIIK